MTAFTQQGSGSDPDLPIRILTRDVNVLRAASRLKAAGRTVTAVDTAGFDWAALRRAMLLQIEMEAAALLELDSLSPSLRAALEFGKNATFERKKKAAIVMGDGHETVRSWMDGGLLLLPSTPGPAFPFDTPVPADQADYATLSSLTGFPSISVPAPVAAGELPIGVQLVAPLGSDASLLASAALLA
jgi:Asp-tRNA(Asn)/Glu-tRNA(Gln) amidotransferase A subunit family amidase